LEEDDKFIDSWREIRKKGKLKYILIYIIKFIIVIIITNIIIFSAFIIYQVFVAGIDILIIHNIFDRVLDIHMIKKTLLKLLFILILDTIMTYLNWYKNEKRYNQLLNNK